MEEAKFLKLVVVGHVDHGKSSVIGRLFYDTGSFPQGTIDKARQVAKETGKPFELAYLLDAFEEERQQGITIDTTRLQFKTARRDYVIIDAPGHKEFLKNMISGAADAEAAFLVVDAARGVEEQSKRHAYLLSLLGINQIGVIINKMDLVGYDEKIFQSIQNDLEDYFSALGLTARHYLPLSALAGENILKPSDLMGWYEGPSLIEALDSLERQDADDNSALRLPIQDVYKFDDRRIIAGRVESGRIKVGDQITIQPGGKTTKVLSLAYWADSDRRQEASAGQSIGITVADEFFNRRGEIISLADRQPLVADTFRASVFWLGRTPLAPGRKYKLKLATQEEEAEVQKVLKVIDASTLATENLNQQVGLNEVAEVLISVRVPVALDAFSACRATGRFVLVDGYDVAGGGLIIETESALAQQICSFVDQDLRARCELFEEYYYSPDDLAVKKQKSQQGVYHKGEAIPLEGLSYSYPEFFDIAVMRDNVAVKIRGGRVTELMPLEQYEFEGLPVVNGRGFAFKVKSRAEWQACREDFARPDKNEAGVSARWLNFNTYRGIPFSQNDWVI